MILQLCPYFFKNFVFNPILATNTYRMYLVNLNFDLNKFEFLCNRCKKADYFYGQIHVNFTLFLVNRK